LQFCAFFSGSVECAGLAGLQYAEALLQEQDQRADAGQFCQGDQQAQHARAQRGAAFTTITAFRPGWALASVCALRGWWVGLVVSTYKTYFIF
jgi:hypothetical protein